jgi:hypothetical protein
MLQRGITKEEVKTVLESDNGIEVPGIPDGRRKWVEVNGRTIKVSYYETDDEFTIITTSVKD